MALSASLFAGLTGLSAHQSRMDVIGDNISNVNTTGYKSGRVDFETAFSRTMGIGSSPSGDLGGTNPQQIGMGVGIAATTRNFAQGAIEITSIGTDLAIEGQGFFMLSDENGGLVYTRDGSFRLNPELYLTNSAGYFVQGFMADGDFQITPSGAVERLRIPVGQLTVAKATDNASFTGNLNAAGNVSTKGSNVVSNAFVDTLGAPATAATLLTDLRDPADLLTPLFNAGNVLTVSARKGTRELPDANFAVTAASTFGGIDPTISLAAFVQQSLGINTSAGVPLSPGVSISAGGALSIFGNGGTANQIKQMQITNSGSASPPFTFTEAVTADGESFSSPFTAYNSLGTAVVVNVTFVMEQKTTEGNTWRWYAESKADTDGGLAVGTGTVTFGTDGILASESGAAISVDMNNMGAGTPLLIDPDFTGLTQLADDASGVALTFQDGAPQGTLIDFEIGQDGRIVGIFNNGQLRELGQVALANFTNYNGLFNEGNNMYTVGPNSGTPMVTMPGQMGSGKLVSSALELSNVDLAKEFVDLIITTSGFTANSRIITTSEQMLDELLNIAR